MQLDRFVLRPIPDREPSVPVFDEGGTTLHPVAVVAVEHPIDMPDLSAMDMTADHAIDAATTYFVGDRLLETRDVVHGVLDLVLEITRERPVLVTEESADTIEVPIHLDREVVGLRTEGCEPAAALDHAVELIAMQNEQTLAERRRVDTVALDHEITEHRADELPEIFIVVARYVDHACAVLGFTQNRTQHVVVLLRPVERFAQAPEVDDVADEIKIVGVNISEEGEKRRGIAAARTEMDIRNEDAANPMTRIVCGAQGPDPAWLSLRAGCASRVATR